VGNMMYFTLTLEYGESEIEDPFNSSRVNKENFKEASKSQFLHPVIRQYHHGALKTTHHVLEDLVADWTSDEHMLPLKKYLKNVFSYADIVKANATVIERV